MATDQQTQLLLLVGKQGGGGPVLAYTSVLLVTGDSQGVGTLSTADQAAAVAAYVVTANVKVLNSSGAFVTYTPGTITGVDGGSGNTGKVGSEIGFIAAFRAAYPNDTLYIIKNCASGSYQTRGAASGTAANITSPGGNGYSLNSGSLIGNNTLITGSGIETGCYIPFSPFLASVGLAGGRSGAAFGPTAITQYNGTISWSSTEGLTYNGNSANINNGARAAIVAGLALLTSPRIVAHVHNIGTNDAGLASAAAFATDLDNIYTRFGADFAGYNLAKTVLVRSTTGQTSSTTVRAAQLAKRNQTSIFLLDTDSYTKWDGTHWDLAAHTDMGGKIFNIWQGTYLGI
jgi:hypothetical protein